MWKSIIGWEGYYSVNENGDVKNDVNGNLIKGDINSVGYYRVCLYNKNNIPSKQRFFRHRLVAIHFIENTLNLKEVNHIDGDKSNNHKENLEWINRKENELHCRKEINTKEYKPYKVCYLNDDEIIYNVKSDLSNKLNVTTACVKNWLHGKSKGYINYGIKEIKYV
ncbi:MAG: HNH endonuclease [Terrisporobacter othiniensis]|nr:HNH endonuclease [Terrisporobacter othiniensis]